MGLRREYKSKKPGHVPAEWETITLGGLEQRGDISLHRGKVISQKDIDRYPGHYPIYSSSVHSNGLFGRYGHYMFDEELITWSVDGGGHFFYRPKHRFSVTNVCGYLRVRSPSIDYRFLAYQLQLLHARKTFDYTLKAHPSVIRGAYIVAVPDISEQHAIAATLGDVDALIAALDRLIAKKRDVKQGVMQQLLTGRSRLPGFRGEWVKRTFGECFDFLATGSNARRELSVYGDTKYIHYGDIHTLWSLVLDCERDTIPFIPRGRVKHLPLLQNGDLVIVDASEDYEGIGVSVELKNVDDQEIVAGLHTLLLRGDKTKVADGYKAYLTSIKAVKDSLIAIATGISVFGISKSNLASVEIPLPPTTEEQQAIAAVLSDIDAEIAALEVRRDKTRALKQGMMQELLTGRIRLI